MKKLFCIFLLLAVLASADAQKIEPLPANLQALRPTDIFLWKADTGYVFSDKNKDTKPSVFSTLAQNNSSPLFTAENKL